MNAAERTLVEFVIWELRTGDLPPHVREAAQSLAAAYPRPERLRGAFRKTDGRLVVTVFPRDEEVPLERLRVFPHQAGAVVDEVLTDDPAYVLIQDCPPAA